MKKNKILLWILRIVPAFIMLQTVFFKFTSAPVTIYIFETLGVEPWGRYASGIGEIIAGVLLLIPRTTWMGATLGLLIMGGALMSHLTVLGINVDGGPDLFIMGIVAFVCCALNIWIHKPSSAGN